MERGLPISGYACFWPWIGRVPETQGQADHDDGPSRKGAGNVDIGSRGKVRTGEQADHGLIADWLPCRLLKPYFVYVFFAPVIGRS